MVGNSNIQVSSQNWPIRSDLFLLHCWADIKDIRVGRSSQADLAEFALCSFRYIFMTVKQSLSSLSALLSATGWDSCSICCRHSSSPSWLPSLSSLSSSYLSLPGKLHHSFIAVIMSHRSVRVFGRACVGHVWMQVKHWAGFFHASSPPSPVERRRVIRAPSDRLQGGAFVF